MRRSSSRSKIEKIQLLIPPIQEKGQIKLHIYLLDLAGWQYFVNVGVYE